ncbi:FBLN7 protein, partial [Smithornis capensis]|nr:FBLN7 protein [Smithornis capensis]
QECLSRQQALSAVRQMQKLLAAQEAAHLQGTRGLRHQLSILQSRLQRQATKRNETCPQLAVPMNGRMLGRSVRVGHDIHFVCNAGFRLVGSETRTCRHNHTWSGTQPFCRSEVGQGWGVMGSALRMGSSITLSHGVPLLCPEAAAVGAGMKEGCISPAGAHKLLLPRVQWGQPHSLRITTTDVNECTGKQHNCTQGDLCINTFGGHRCVRPKCPPPRHNTSYVKTSAFQCERNPCPMESRACHLAATSISFHYLPLQANRTVPRVLFKMSTTRFVGDSLRFAITGGRGQGVFSVRRSDRQTGELLLTSPVAGPATLEVELEMSEFSRKVLLGKHIFKVTVFVSPYVF